MTNPDALQSIIMKGGFDYSLFGAEIGAEFEAVRLVDASILWLNQRWFAERDVNLTDPETRQRVERWLLQEYAYLVLGPADPASAVDETDRLRFEADRYGLTGGGWHGGSGRCGYRNRFHAKGIGQTPMVSVDADPLHSSGMMMLWEALMETLTSELAAAELPYGAVPTIAIMDAGFSTAVPGYGDAERRALMVRPNFVRPAHMERSIFFHDGSVPNQAQIIDVIRVRAVLKTLLADTGIETFLREVFLRDARQLGATHAHRLWLGVFASSNRSITGELADFGACRTVPDWRGHFTVQPEQFGRELPHLTETLHSLRFYIGKYGSAQAEPEEPLQVDELRAEVAEGFKSACCEATGCSRAVSAALFAEFERQQREDVAVGADESWCRSWFSDALEPEPSNGLPGTSGLVALIQQEEGIQAKAVLAALRRWLLPRPALTQASMAVELPNFVRALSGTSAERAIQFERFVWQQLSLARRHWPDAPKGLAIEGQACGPGLEVLFGWDEDLGARGTWLVASCTGPWRDLLATPDAIRLPRNRFGLWFEEPQWHALMASDKWAALKWITELAFYY